MPSQFSALIIPISSWYQSYKKGFRRVTSTVITYIYHYGKSEDTHVSLWKIRGHSSLWKIRGYSCIIMENQRVLLYRYGKSEGTLVSLWKIRGYSCIVMENQRVLMYRYGKSEGTHVSFVQLFHSHGGNLSVCNTYVGYSYSS